MRIASTSSWKPGTVVTTVIVLRWQSVTVYDPVSSLFAAAEDHLRLWRCWGWWRRCWPWNPKNRSCWCVVEAKAWKEAQSEMWKCFFIGFFCFLTQSKWNLGYCMSLRLRAIWHRGPIQSSCHRSWMVLVTIASGETNKQNRCLGHILGHLLHMEPSRTKASVFCMFSMSNLSKKCTSKTVCYTKPLNVRMQYLLADEELKCIWTEWTCPFGQNSVCESSHNSFVKRFSSVFLSFSAYTPRNLPTQNCLNFWDSQTSHCQNGKIVRYAEEQWNGTLKAAKTTFKP